MSELLAALIGSIAALLGAWVGGMIAGREQRMTENYKSRKKDIEKLLHLFEEFAETLQLAAYERKNSEEEKESKNIPEKGKYKLDYDEKENRRIKVLLFHRLNGFFEERWDEKMDLLWSRKFKKFIGMQNNKQWGEFRYTYRFWLLFDVPCLEGKRPVCLWAEQFAEVIEKGKQLNILNENDILNLNRIISEMESIHLQFYQVISCSKGLVTVEPVFGKLKSVKRVIVEDPIKQGSIICCRLSKLGKRHEIVGSYTTYNEKILGPLMSLFREKKDASFDPRYWRSEGLQILGWLMNRATVYNIESSINSQDSEPSSNEGVQYEIKRKRQQMLRQLNKCEVLGYFSRINPIQDSLSIFLKVERSLSDTSKETTNEIVSKLIETESFSETTFSLPDRLEECYQFLYTEMNTLEKKFNPTLRDHVSNIKDVFKAN